jgi:GntR family transcriptional repressor for pyruvate dehydrogenase complex
LETTTSTNDIKRSTASKPLHSEIVDKIIELIKKGELTQGDQLLSERELADRFKVSRTTIRRALAVLAGMGILDITSRDGAYIRVPNLGEVMEPLIQVILQSHNQMTYLFEVRQIIESQAVRLAATRRQESDVEHLWAIHRQLVQEVNEKKTFIDADTFFHVGIVESAHNPLLTDLMSALVSPIIQISAPAWHIAVTQEVVEADRFIEEHAQIVRAIEDKDPDRAADLINQHIEHARSFWKNK